MPRLTKRFVEALPAREAEYFEWCSDLPGFGVRVFPSGKRSYLVQYRTKGRSRRAAIGLHGRVTADEARKLAQGLLGDVAKGGDPAEDRANQWKAAMTVADLCERYTAASIAGLIPGKHGAKRPRTLVNDASMIKRHIVPLLGRRSVRELTHVHVNGFIRDVAAGKTEATEKTGGRGKSIVRGGMGIAARSAGLLGSMLTFAVSEGVCSATIWVKAGDNQDECPDRAVEA